MSTSDPNSRGFAARALAMSYRRRFSKHSLANAGRKILGRQQINPYARQFFQVDLQTTEIEQRRARHGIDQQIQIAPVSIITTRHGAEYSGIAQAAAFDELSNLFAVLVESL